MFTRVCTVIIGRVLRPDGGSAGSDPWPAAGQAAHCCDWAQPAVGIDETLFATFNGSRSEGSTSLLSSSLSLVMKKIDSSPKMLQGHLTNMLKYIGWLDKIDQTYVLDQTSVWVLICINFSSDDKRSVLPLRSVQNSVWSTRLGPIRSKTKLNLNNSV